jgi:peroxiredoxin
MAIKAGDTAPDFTLFDQEKKEHSLASLLKNGKTVLAFYPGAFTGVCSKEVCTLRDSLAALNGLKAHVVGISVDSPFANKAFAEQNKLTFPLLSDYTHEVAKKFVGVYDSFAGLPGNIAAKRAIVILDAKGTVRYVWITDNPGIEPPYDEIPKALAAF